MTLLKLTPISTDNSLAHAIRRTMLRFKYYSNLITRRRNNHINIINGHIGKMSYYYLKRSFK